MGRIPTFQKLPPTYLPVLPIALAALTVWFLFFR